MKNILIAITAIAAIGGTLFYVAQSPDCEASAACATEQARLSLPANTVIYDVRTAGEFAAGHATDAVLLPLADIQAGSYPSVDKDAPIAVYCRSGNRSAQATDLLRDAGYTNITDIGAYNNLSDYGITTT